MNPCYKCEKRHPGCHGSCKEYTNWKSAHDNERERIQKEKIRDRELTERAVIQVRKSKKK